MDILREGLRAFLVGGDPQRPPTRGRRRMQVFVWLLASALFLGTWSYLVSRSNLPRPLLPVWSLVTVVPLFLLLDRPLLAWRVSWLSAVVGGLTIDVFERTPWPWHPIEFAVMPITLFLVALRHPRRVTIWVWASAMVLVLLFIGFSVAPGLIAAITVIMFLGDQIQRRREAQTRLADETERSQLEAARRTVLEERTRIARELHDVVAHHMSLIAVRAETAPYRLEGVAEPVAEEFAAIANASREALTDMRRLLGVLRSESPPLTEPQPGVENLPDLVEAANGAGVEVRLDVEPGLEVPPAVGLTAYRIVQEALSNARRHAGGAPVAITLGAEDDRLAVTIVNGPGTASGEPWGSGQGLAGMRDRAFALGGSLTAIPTSDGGFVVQAQLPMADKP
jgi:signal transduction histidine kinase